MEFDKVTPASEQDRRLAETKKLTLQPLHDNVAPEAISDTETVAHHLVEPAIANVSNDVEQDATLVQPSAGLLSEIPLDAEKKPIPSKTISVATIAIAFIGAVIFFFLVK